ncbi:hypothetical protein B9Z55_015615 [Caenorhabditis nigoni]|uniref:Uncharacterized protein n=1 Tax=Caenorhabditis nigoni TaxID=1611254 RepID=A0A2G5UBL8_9PELO|nr:hypothetical protein B9Z55_015615 [Caenorhabditis nigoni]
MVKAPECRPKKSEDQATLVAPPTAQAPPTQPPAEDQNPPEGVAEQRRPIHPNERLRNQPVREEWVSITAPEPRAPRQTPREREAEHRANAERAHRQNNPLFEYMVNERARREEPVTVENYIRMDTIRMMLEMRAENNARVPTAPIATDYVRQAAQRNTQRRNEVQDELEFLGM